ncbi:type IV secretion system DNA-binding domain-containing protein [Empedobacter stercoris]|uniref:type IV secretory system conjugative DNA transfer family protein n=1 Tax=Empedobacter stercoris TaxID=1628248 RepID=UPI0021AFEC00|nr:type IV secretory system conjugative DNA transfer family protein [Empedobacter stercoris]UWX66187.1 type IV secretion system DNA-binding domain-containing protein [Empedobacter stercoris]
MQEQQYQLNLYSFFQKLVYAIVALDCISLFYGKANIPVLSNLLQGLIKTGFIYPPINAKFATLIFITLVAIGTKAKKKKELNITTNIIIPIIIGLTLMFASLVWQNQAESQILPTIIPGLNAYQLLYACLSFLGAVITQMGADSISKFMQQKMGKDRWNVEEESFDQNKELIDTPTSINIPYLFKYKGKNNKGWMNINPFRGTMVIGTPGSGKSFGVINPAIRQMISKGFCLCIYDFKFPDLAQIAYYHYLLKKSKESDYNYDFHVINLNNVEMSKRVNPFDKKYVQTLAEAQEMAEAMVSSLQKGGASAGGGSDQFFTQSAINFLSSTIYFFATYENGKYSDLPHILSFMNRSYEEIFDTLFQHEELVSLLSPFKSAYDNKAFDQLEGQVGTLKIFLSRLATKESYWVFSGDEVELKITDKQNPSILILASDPTTQDINSALYSSVLNRTLRVINSKNNLPGGIIADEFPTIYIHKIDNVVATARSNKIAVLLGLQELPQLRQFYKKEVADTISAIVGNILSGSARDKNTLDWLEKMFGKIKQKTFSQSISQQGSTTSINEKMDNMIPAGKIAALKTGEMVGIIAQESNTEEYKTSAFNGKISLNMNEIKKEEENYPKLPVYYSFVDHNRINRKEDVLMTNFRKINREVELLVNEQRKTTT